MKKIFDKRKMTPEQWQEYRGNQTGEKIGGSDVASILGLNPYKSKFELWLEKTGQVPKPKLNNQFIEWGNLLEPVIREKFKQETGFKVYQNNFVLQHDEHEFMVANLDGEVCDPSFPGRGVLEIKTTHERNKKQWENGCPIHYHCQIQHYLAVTGYEYAYVCCLCGGNDFRYFLIERNDYVIDQIIREEMEFVRMVKENIPPEIGGSKSESEWLHRAFPTSIEEEILLPGPLEELAIEYNVLQQEIEERQARAEEIKNKIKLEGKEYKTLRGNKVKISMPTISKMLFDSNRFSSEHPELYQKYRTKESTYRKFSVTLLEE